MGSFLGARPMRGIDDDWDDIDLDPHGFDPTLVMANSIDQHRIYKRTSIARPLDPSFATNKAVLRLMPLAGIVAGAATALGGANGPQIVGAVLAGVIVVLGAWAVSQRAGSG